MYAFLQKVGLRAFVAQEAMYLSLSLMVTELFYKFHSFTLEVVGFLATWYLLSWLGATLFRHHR